jgi:hypothetical protein
MNMETLSNTNFDRLEKLLCTKRFDELSIAEKQWVESLLSEEEYASMSVLYTSLNNEKQSIGIEPQADTKVKLNKALAAKVKHPGIFQLKMPVYQSVAAALIFFLVSFGINQSRTVETKIVHNTVQVIKYISKPEATKNLAAESKNTKKRAKRVITIPEQDQVLSTQSDIVVSIPESNPEFARQQEIAMTNIKRVMNEKNGSSMGADTVLQKMLVTVY